MVNNTFKREVIIIFFYDVVAVDVGHDASTALCWLSTEEDQQYAVEMSRSAYAVTTS